VRVEGANEQGSDFETLMIEGKALRERRIAQRGEPVQRDIPQVNRSEFLAEQSHDISPLRFQVYKRLFSLVRHFFTEARRSHGRLRHYAFGPAPASQDEHCQ
jgi:hypothetical protein